jgi:hypothetical protein
MEGEHSPALEEVVVSEAEVPRPEATVSGSSSGDGTGDRSGDGTGGQDEDSGTVDPGESDKSYDFGPSTIIVCRI